VTYVNVDVDLERCPEAIGYHQVDARGRCYWCRRQVEYPSPRPRRFERATTDRADRAYRYFYDPDWGIDKDDI
jgi:myo-inositol catabolism protein IolC